MLICLEICMKQFITFRNCYKMGNQRDKPETVKNSFSEKCSRMSYAVSSMCGWRLFMEDAHLAICPFNSDQNMALFAVFDGHGGPECANFAKDHFPKCLLQNQFFLAKQYQKALIETFLQIDRLMQTSAGKKTLKNIREQHAKKNNASDYEGNTVSGTTANVCLITRDEIYVANAGDSRTIGIFRQIRTKTLKVKQLSHDHKPSLQTEKKRIQRAGGMINFEGRINQNLNLSRALGDFSYKDNAGLKLDEQMVIAQPQVLSVKTRDVNYILMGCDGIWQRKSRTEMAKSVMGKIEKGKTMKDALELMLDEQVGRSSQSQIGMDNMTAILIHIP